jgi:hypothetical protein
MPMPQVDTDTVPELANLCLRSASGTAALRLETYVGGLLFKNVSKTVGAAPQKLPDVLGSDWSSDTDGLKVLDVSGAPVHFAYSSDPALVTVDSQRIDPGSYQTAPYLFGRGV